LAILQILKECIDESNSTYLAMRLLQQCDVSELAARGTNGLSLGHPLTDISLGEQAQVRLDLVVELEFRSSISEQPPKPRHHGAHKMDHYLYSWPSSLNRRPAPRRFAPNSAVSRASCFRPLFVIE
jgi:hypothetical protein